MAVTLTQVKALVTVPANTITDPQIEALLLVETELYAAVAALCYLIASFYASQFDVASGKQKAALSQRHRNFMALARRYERRSSRSVAPGSFSGAVASEDSAFTNEKFNGRGV